MAQIDSKKNEIIIFTDGSSRGNPGPGGWGAIVVSGEKITEIGGSEERTTNNRMEMAAASAALKSENSLSSCYIVYTDSSYLINGITKWVNGWQRNNWKTKDGGMVLNKDLWQELISSVGEKRVEWKYIGGHSGIHGNERCDVIATTFADSLSGGEKPNLFVGQISKYKDEIGVDILNLKLDEKKSESKASTRARSSTRAYSYVSMVNGVISRDRTWAECEAKVKGVKGARFKKSISPEDESSIIKEWQNK